MPTDKALPLLGMVLVTHGRLAAEMVRAMIPEELVRVKATVSAQGEDTASYEQAAGIFEKMSLAPDFTEFLTLPLYEAMH